MLAIIVCSMINFMIEIKEKLESQQRTKREQNFNQSRTRCNSFQPMLLNSKFLHKKMRFRWSLFLSDKEKNKSGSRAYLSSKHKNVF